MIAEKNKIKKRKNIKTTIFVYGLILWPLIYFLVFWLYVNVDTIFLSFETLDYNKGGYVFVGFRNYADLIKWIFEKSPNDMLVYAIRNSFSIVLFILFVLIPISIIFAFVMHKKVPMGGIFKVIFFLPNIISSVIMVMLFKLMFDPNLGPVQTILNSVGLGWITPRLGWFGDINTSWSMVLLECLWAGIGYDMVLFMSAFNRIPPEILESAKLDGAGVLREFWQISLPLIAPTLSTMIILGSTSALTFFMNPLLLTNGGPEGSSTTLMLLILNNVKSGSSGLPIASAIGIMFSIVLLPIVFAIRKVVEKVLPPVEF